MNHTFFQKKYVYAGVVVLGFLIVSTFAATFVRQLPADTLLRGGWGMVAYVSIVVINAVLIVPVSSVPLIPIASELWGPITTALLSTLGWTVGALIAFLIARRWGRPVIDRFFPDNRVERSVRSIPKHRLFWSIVLLRMIMPVDVLSYALGTTAVRFTTYAAATVLGVIPFAFIFSYGATVSLSIQVGGIIVITGLVILINYNIYKRII